MKNIYGKNVFITGAGSGIGREAARLFAQSGCNVFALSRSIEETEEELPCGGKITGVRMDVTQEESVKSAVGRVLQKCGSIDIVMHCAGMGISGAAEDAVPDETENIFSTNYFGVLRVNRYVLPSMRRQGKGLVIIVSSIAGRISIPFQSHYSSTKFALEAYAEALAMEAEEYGIRVSIIEPGDTKTGFTSARKSAMPKDSPYAKRCELSISKMAHDEQNGHSADKPAKIALKLAGRKSPPVRVPVGAAYKAIMILEWLLPAKLLRFAVKKLYIK